MFLVTQLLTTSPCMQELESNRLWNQSVNFCSQDELEPGEVRHREQVAVSGSERMGAGEKTYFCNENGERMAPRVKLDLLPFTPHHQDEPGPTLAVARHSNYLRSLHTLWDTQAQPGSGADKPAPSTSTKRAHRSVREQTSIPEEGHVFSPAAKVVIRTTGGRRAERDSGVKTQQLQRGSVA